VQAAQALVLLTQGRIGPVGQEQDAGDHRQQPGHLPVVAQHDHRDQGQAAGRDGRDHTGDQGLEHVAAGDDAVVEADRGQHQGGADQIGGQHGGEGGGQADGAAGRAAAQHGREHDAGQARLQQGQGEVEGQLAPGLAGADDQGQDRPAELCRDQPDRPDQVQAEHQRQLDQVDRVDLAAELDVDLEQHGRGDQGGQHRPGHAHAVRRRQRPDRPGHQRGNRRHHEGGQGKRRHPTVSHTD
jgi:hypothetical protein